MKGCHGHQLPSYLDEFMWRERYGTSTLLALQNIMRDIAVHTLKHELIPSIYLLLFIIKVNHMNQVVLATVPEPAEVL